MINITTTKDIPGYAKPYVLASITHAFKPSDLTHIVEQAVKTGHLKAIIAGLPEEIGELLHRRDEGEADTRRAFILTNPYDPIFNEQVYYGKSGKLAAIEEANRMAKEAPGTYKVIGLEYSVRSTARTTIEKVEALEVIRLYP